MKFQIVHTIVDGPDGPENRWRPRIRAANGEITWWTEHYNRRDDARKAVITLARMFGREAKITHGLLIFDASFGNASTTSHIPVEEIEG